LWLFDLYRRICTTFVCVAIAASRVVAAPSFSDIAPDLGIDHRYTGEWEHFVGGGVAVFDCDGDKRPEIFAAGGASPSLLLHNRGNDSRDAPKYARAISSGLDLKGVTGAYPLDIDGDGHMDLAVLRVGPNLLMRGVGDCRFEDASARWGYASTDRWTTAFSATWLNDASWPTLAIGNYVNRRAEGGPFGACDTNFLIPSAEAGFRPAQSLLPGHCALSMLFSDWGRKGQRDLRISNDRHYYRGGAEQLWDMSGSAPALYSEQSGWGNLQIWGMGIASRDLDGDGYPEIMLTSMGDQKLRSLEGDRSHPSYADSAYERGVTAHVPHTGDDRRPSTGWHAAFGDIDNDGLDDLFISKGNVEAMTEAASFDPDNLLLGLPSGRFTEVGREARIANPARSRGAALVDLNRDGRLDIVVNRRNAPLAIYVNDTPNTGHWLQVRLVQNGGNRDAVGAWIEVRVEGLPVKYREITVGGGHASGAMSFEHFGLGPTQHARVLVTWPDGKSAGPYVVEADGFFEIVRNRGPVHVSP